MDITKRQLDLAEVPEIEENPYHPQNDQFNKQNEQVKRVIMAHQRQMAPKHVQITKLHHQGHTNVKISEMVKVNPNTVGKVLQRPDSLRLGDLLNYLEASIEGPSIAHRKAVLNRIMVDNEEKQPKVALAAIAEMNKMGVQQHNMDNDPNAPQQTNITINQNFFPRTSLDG